MEAVDHSQLSGAMLAFLWEEFIKRARVPAVAVDIVLLRLGLSLDSSGQQREELRAAHERWYAGLRTRIRSIANRLKVLARQNASEAPVSVCRMRKADGPLARDFWLSCVPLRPPCRVVDCRVDDAAVVEWKGQGAR